MNSSDSKLGSLYPDVDPRTPLPADTGVRIAFSVASAVLVFGSAYGDLIIAGVGVVLLLLTALAVSRKTGRRIRSEARERFPSAEWAEYEFPKRRRLAMPALWLVLLAGCLVVLILVPANFALTGATAMGLIAAALMWFAPGLAPVATSKA